MQAAIRPEPLSNHFGFASCEPEVTWKMTSRLFGPHKLDVMGLRLDAKLNRLTLGALSFNYLRYGADVMVSGALTKFFVVHTLLSGKIRVRVGSEEVFSVPGSTVVGAPHLPAVTSWDRDSTAFIVLIERRELERFAELQVGRRIRKPLEFPLGAALQAPGQESWYRLVTTLADCLDRDGSLWSSPMILKPYEQFVMAAVLRLFPHNFTAALTAAPEAAPRPYYVKRAEDFIHARAHEPITIEDLTAAACVSARTLYAGFRRFKGMGPIGYLKRVRLERVREELLHAAPGETTVTETALRWGFASPGHFALEYRVRFGETPSATLRRRPA
jgi:AraC-like DNA-binding protein